MRYLKAALLIGTASALAVLLLYATGFLTNTPEAVLRKAFALSKPMVVPQLWQIILFTILAYAAAWTTVDITRPALKAVVAFTAMFLLATWSQVLALLNVFFNPLPSISAILLSFAIGLAYGRSSSGARKRIIERLFSQRVSRGTFSRLVNSDIPADFPGEKIEGSIIVCEVQNHTELIELLAPADYAAMTNLYLQTASDYLVEVGGYLDECTGESLRVVFGAPLPDEAHAAKVCRAALDLLARLDILNKECDATWQRRFDFRMGVNSGVMVGAAYGGSRLASYSVAGPPVEFARRLSAACGVYGCRILIGPETFEAAADGLEVRPIEVLKNLGPLRRAELYEILAPKHG
ncbi:MAG: adenylate/guanylate cyclase domain-containing protein, partial [Terrimicrobiaceae bacterium]|nr:adenylate/guanylate cyclase domain-containing protein [Terrimicrobiaceae bacterium]